MSLDLASGAVSELSGDEAGGRELVSRRSLGSVEGRYHTSADGRHVLASQRDPEGGIWQAYRWTVRASDSGVALGEMSHHSANAAFVVADSSLIYLTQPSYRVEGGDVIAQPMQLQAFDLSSGQTLWKRQVADPNYSGPIAP